VQWWRYARANDLAERLPPWLASVASPGFGARRRHKTEIIIIKMSRNGESLRWPTR